MLTRGEQVSTHVWSVSAKACEQCALTDKRSGKLDKACEVVASISLAACRPNGSLPVLRSCAAPVAADQGERVLLRRARRHGGVPRAIAVHARLGPCLLLCCSTRLIVCGCASLLRPRKSAPTSSSSGCRRCRATTTHSFGALLSTWKRAHHVSQLRDRGIRAGCEADRRAQARFVRIALGSAPHSRACAVWQKRCFACTWCISRARLASRPRRLHSRGLTSAPPTSASSSVASSPLERPLSISCR